MAPLVIGQPGARPTNGLEAISGRHECKGWRPVRLCCVPTRNDDRDRERECFYCLSGWVLLGTLDHDGGEVVEDLRCRRCGGTGRMCP
jgi:hypothetical protein